MTKTNRNDSSENRKTSTNKVRVGETVETESRRGDEGLVRCLIVRDCKRCIGIDRRRCWPPSPPAGCSSPSLIGGCGLRLGLGFAK
ncbi:hypothetical protein Hanom_Chr01g00079801 [Helianthus anomalus]